MNTALRSALALAGLVFAANAAAEVTFYENDNFHGRSFSTERPVDNFERNGFNDRASSVIVRHERWEVCDDARFSGKCVILRPGQYPSLASLGMNNRISSARIVNREARVDDYRYAPAPVPVYDYHRRDGERLYEANVTSVHAVVGPPEQRCWTEREQVQDRGSPNVGGAVVGAVIGGILGHQIGNGRGNDVATAGGAIAGAAVGSNVGRDNGQTYGHDVQRCSTVQGSAQPEYWDVVYVFRGQEHRMQMTTPPGPTVTVNGNGEPRA
ncbi:MAG TPA: beta/gamma crystallin-related protein [Usitatibacter sp.]